MIELEKDRVSGRKAEEKTTEQWNRGGAMSWTAEMG